MEFEYNPQKSESNLTKHGIGFEETKHLWDDVNRFQIAPKVKLNHVLHSLLHMVINFGQLFSQYEKNEFELFQFKEQEMEKEGYIMKAKELDKIFDKGEDISPYLDLSTKNRPGLKQRRVNVDFPDWIIKSLDREASKIGVTRQSTIKVWIAERIKIESNHNN